MNSLPKNNPSWMGETNLIAAKNEMVVDVTKIISECSKLIISLSNDREPRLSDRCNEIIQLIRDTELEINNIEKVY